MEHLMQKQHDQGFASKQGQDRAGGATQPFWSTQVVWAIKAPCCHTKRQAAVVVLTCRVFAFH